jgi:DNA-binding NtrC family response regulator
MSAVNDEGWTLRDRPTPQIQLKTIELEVVSGPDAQLRVSFCLPTIRVGTDADNDLVLTDRYVSRHHLELRMQPEGLVLRDLWSSNGTFIDSHQVTERPLGVQTLLTLGRSVISVRQQTEAHRVPIAPRQDRLGALVGASPPMRELYSLIRAAAPTQATVLILGESGCGKELVARTLHELSERAGTLVVFDASVADPELIRSDLFGHVKGAFTGAAYGREGAFRQAQRGTLFIDEIGEIPLELQTRLLRALENREVTPAGSDRPVRVDVRVIAATHRDLQAMVAAGQFRADLFYRLAVIEIKVPALREIRADLPLIVEHLLERLSLPCHLSPEAMRRLQCYSWPGNVRELRNVLERAAVFYRGDEIRPEHLGLPQVPVSPPEQRAPSTSIPSSTAPLPPLPLCELERQRILEALVRNDNALEKTARELGIAPATLRRKLKAFKKPFKEESSD